MNFLRNTILYAVNLCLNLYLRSKKNICIGSNIRFKKAPLINVHKKATVQIGNNVLINSDNHNYHLNMHSRCKIMADRPGAVIQIGNNCRIHGTCIHAYQSIIIGNNCLIAANTQIMDGNAHNLSFSNTANRINTTGTVRPVVIEDNVWIGANVIVLPGVTIGNGSVIAAGSIVNKDIPPMVVASGNPAVVIKKEMS